MCCAGRRFWTGKEHQPTSIFFISTLQFSGSGVVSGENHIFKRLGFRLEACIFQLDMRLCISSGILVRLLSVGVLSLLGPLLFL